MKIKIKMLLGIAAMLFSMNNSSWGQIVDNGEHRFSPNNQTIQVGNSYTPSIGIVGDNSGTTAAWSGPSGWGVTYAETFTPGPAGDYSRPFGGNTVVYRIWRVPVITLVDNGNGTWTIPVDVKFTPTGGGLNDLENPNGSLVGSDQSSYIVSGTGIQTFKLKTYDGFPANGWYELSIPITFAAALSNDATLSSLTVSTGTLTPTFNAAILNYTVDVANSVSSITINATANHAAASVSGTGNKTLNVGSNPFNVVVTAEDGTQKTYTVTVNRAAPATYTVIASAGAGGIISPSGEVEVPEGGSQTFTATPNQGYKVKGWILDGDTVARSGNVYSLNNILADHTLKVVFDLSTGIEHIETCIKIYTEGSSLIVESDVAMTSVVIYNLSGQTLRFVQVGSSQARLNALPQGIFVARISLQGGAVCTKKLLIK